MARRATAQDVADLAGVSRSAVSLVLNGRGAGNISAANQDAIRAAAAVLSYTPDAVALSLRKQRTRTIGALTWARAVGSASGLLVMVNQAANRAGYLLNVVNVLARPDLVEVLLDRRVDGFLVLAPELDCYPVPDELAGSPVVLVNCVDEDGRATSLVADEAGAGASAARVLLAAGHERVTVLACSDCSMASELRVRGITRELVAAGLPPPPVVRVGHDVADGHAATLRLLQGPDRPTAVVGAGERLALGALLAAQAAGLSVPRDLSLVSLDDGESLARHVVPALTLVQRPDLVIAEHAFEAFVGLLNDASSPPRQLSFVCPVREGDSVGPPSR